jgi:hypothetical protein
MAIILKAIYMFNEISIQVPMIFFTKIEKSMLKSYGSTKDLE